MQDMSNMIRCLMISINKWPLRHQALLVTRGALFPLERMNEIADIEKDNIKIVYQIHAGQNTSSQDRNINTN